MHYSFLQNMANSVQAWPEYQKLLEIVREYGVDGDRITRYLWEQSLRGNVINKRKSNGNSLCLYSHT